jgi:hypothetical protein
MGKQKSIKKRTTKKAVKKAAKQCDTRGVSWDATKKKWAVHKCVGGVTHCYGRFTEMADAVAARAAGDKRHGTPKGSRVSTPTRLKLYENATFFRHARYAGYRAELLLQARAIFVERDLNPGVFPCAFLLTEHEVMTALTTPTEVESRSRHMPNQRVTYPFTDARQLQAAKGMLFRIYRPGLTDARTIGIQIRILVWLFKLGVAKTNRAQTNLRVKAKLSFAPRSKKPERKSRAGKKRATAALPSSYSGVTLVPQTEEDADEGEQRATVVLPAVHGKCKTVARQCQTERGAAMEFDQHCRKHGLVKRVNFPTLSAAKAYLEKCQSQSKDDGRTFFCKDPRCKAAARGFKSKWRLKRHADACPARFAALDAL